VRRSSENLKGSDHLVDLDVDGRVILQFILDAASCEHGSEPSGSIKGGKYLD